MQVHVLYISTDEKKKEPELFLFSTESKMIKFIIKYFDIPENPEEITNTTQVRYALYKYIRKGFFDYVEPYFDTCTRNVM